MIGSVQLLVFVYPIPNIIEDPTLFARYTLNIQDTINRNKYSYSLAYAEVIVLRDAEYNLKVSTISSGRFVGEKVKY